jgi:YHS domain-containing protein
VTALKGYDPVELVTGREVAGKEGLAVVRGRFRYLFATPANKVTFEKAPEAFAVQFGGACGKMGPLSGGGHPDRFLVHGKRIYVFASESCRNAFVAAPEKYIDSHDEPPAGTPAEQARGKELLDLVVKGLGGATAVDGATSVRVETTLTYPQKDKPPFVMKRVLIVRAPGQFREEDSYPGWSGVTVATPTGGFQTSGKVAWPLEESDRAYFARQIYRHPLAIVKARGEKGFTVVAAGRGTVGETEVELLKVGVHGATTTLAVDPATGRVLRTTYRGRLGGPIGEVSKTFSDFRQTSGLTLPFGTEVRLDGKPVTNPAASLASVEVNSKLDSDLFKMPD